MPDVYMIWEGIPVWIELKVTKSNSIKVSPTQISWHTSHSDSGGLSFILVKHLGDRSLFLFRGADVRCVASEGLRSEAIWSGASVPGAVEAVFGSGREYFGAIFGALDSGPTALPPSHP